MKLNRFKYFIGTRLFDESCRLFTSLDDALLACCSYDKIDLIPSGHAPWRAKSEGPGILPPSPLSHLGAWCWIVVRVSTYHDGETSETYLGELGQPSDAFALAELRAKRVAERGDKDETYHVALWAYAENGCRQELARMPADHLTQLRRTRQRPLGRAWHGQQSGICLPSRTMQITIVKLDDGKWHHTSAKGTRCGIPRDEGMLRVVATMHVSTNDTFPPKSGLCPKCWPNFPNNRRTCTPRA